MIMVTRGATAIATAPAVYLAIVSAAGLPRPRAKRAVGAPVTRFAVLVPAHDEAVGIPLTLQSLRVLDYPADLFSVHVVADNCADATADVVRQHGFEAHERSAPEEPGKGPALNWLHDRLVDAGAEFDAAVVVDADSTIDSAFLTAMDGAMRSGAVAAQGYYGVRDAYATPGTSFRSAALACRHHLRALGRTRLGGSCGLYGNGMAFRRDLLADRRWTGHLVEDAEFQMELLLDGHRVAYVPDAVLHAEMPHDAGHATSQNERWERGGIELMGRYVPILARRSATRRQHRVAMVDAAIDHLIPPLSVLAGVQIVAAAMSLIGALCGERVARRLMIVNLGAIAAVGSHVVAGLYSVDAPRIAYRQLLAAPRIVAWKIRLWISVVSTDNVAWIRTGRNVESSQ